MRGFVLAVFTVATLSACSGSDKPLHDLRGTGNGPDEFAVLPVKPLEMPTSFSTLPEPTPGVSNLADPNPTGGAYAALGGRSDGGIAGGVPAADSALVQAAGRYGVTPGIRETLANEDESFRRRRGRLSGFGLFGGGNYFRTYASMALDAYAELIRFRNLGVQTPSAPPQ